MPTVRIPLVSEPLSGLSLLVVAASQAHLLRALLPSAGQLLSFLFAALVLNHPCQPGYLSDHLRPTILDLPEMHNSYLKSWREFGFPDHFYHCPVVFLQTFTQGFFGTRSCVAGCGGGGSIYPQAWLLLCSCGRTPYTETVQHKYNHRWLLRGLLHLRLIPGLLCLTMLEGGNLQESAF